MAKIKVNSILKEQIHLNKVTMAIAIDYGEEDDEDHLRIFCDQDHPIGNYNLKRKRDISIKNRIVYVDNISLTSEEVIELAANLGWESTEEFWQFNEAMDMTAFLIEWHPRHSIIIRNHYGMPEDLLLDRVRDIIKSGKIYNGHYSRVTSWSDGYAILASETDQSDVFIVEKK